MRLAPDLAAFLAGPVLMSIATRDAQNRPMIARGSGAWAIAEGERVEVAVSAWLWPETVANLHDNGMIALTVVQPADYRAFQIKGRGLARAATPEDAARAEAYVEATRRVLMDLAVGDSLIRYWLTAREPAVLSFAVDRVFEQTPGPRAGAVVA